MATHQVHIEDAGMDGLKSATLKEMPIDAQKEFLADAQDATNKEHDMTLLQAIKLYPRAVGWSILLSTALVMEGYDTKLVSSLFAQPSFQKAYGHRRPNGSYQVPAPWQAGLNNGSSVGQLIGLLTAGYISERFGFRKTMIIGLTILTGFIFIQFFAPSLPVLEIGQILLGVPLGMFQTVSTVYAVEVTPTCLRAYLTTYVNLCWVFGQITASGVLRGVLPRTDQWAYRIPFGLQWLWPTPLIIGIYFAPESPWWLVRQNRLEEAKAVVLRLTSTTDVAFDAEKNVALMVLTTEREREEGAGTSYLACFKGTDLRRTIIVVGCYCIQILSGNVFRGYSTFFFQQAGLATDMAFNMSIVGYGLGMIGVFIAWFLLPYVGRRTLYIHGLAWMAVVFVAIGGIGVPQSKSPESGYAWAIGALLLLSVFIYDITVGPVAYSLVSEIPSALLRSKSVVIARMAYTILNIVSNIIIPYQLSPTAWNWKAKSGFFWAGSCLIALIFTYFYIPEPKDRTTAELDILFARKISARKFSKTDVKLTDIVNEKDVV